MNRASFWSSFFLLNILSLMIKLGAPLRGDCSWGDIVFVRNMTSVIILYYIKWPLWIYFVTIHSLDVQCNHIGYHLVSWVIMVNSYASYTYWKTKHNPIIPDDNQTDHIERQTSVWRRKQSTKVVKYIVWLISWF